MKDMLQIGNRIPEFSLKNQFEELINIQDLIGKPLVIYFYPKDDTPGCTREACHFRDQFHIFQDFGAEIIGISGDSPKSHLKFAEKHRLKFMLLSDSDRTVEKAFGVPRSLLGLLPGRVTYIIDREGVICHTFKSQTNLIEHVNQSLEILKTL